MAGCGDSFTPEERAQIEKGWNIVEQGNLGDLLVVNFPNEKVEYLLLLRPYRREEPVIRTLCISSTELRSHPYIRECTLPTKDAQFVREILKVGTTRWHAIMEAYRMMFSDYKKL